MNGRELRAVGRWPVPEAARSVLIFGGTFDPPHRGHIELPPLVRQRLGLDWLVYVPARRSPHKQTAPEASDQQRVAMLRAALGDLPNTSISTIELERAAESPSYTIDTLREIGAIVGPDPELRLLIGADQAREFDRWKDPEDIRRLARPAVMRREGESLPDLERWKADLVDVPAILASASEIRAMLARRESSSPALSRLIPEPVLEIIRRDRLYHGDGGTS